MNKKIIALGVLLSATASASAFAASDNTITFQGEVADQTCQVSINGNAGSPVVLLPTVRANDLLTAGQSAGDTTFEVGVTGCTANDTNDIKVSTVFVGNIVTKDGNLGNTGTAKNVEIQIADGLKPATAIDFSKGSYTGAGDLTITSSKDAENPNTSASHEYIASYFSTGGATVGSVAASLQYAVTYQ
ncbi:fimbrial protein [Klebsiella sp. BIGb0407]|uniref:fimbrial protein n=1 Tax=Klebsiella sp. BIGb0407 TaxID=2940603 RepID=UPI0021692090|nr:fimbrial protein [Klebsiella sp. BIGb0407]MCS3433212.1 major type 1 subunit fimbrin (pilin) [Klebsiella sp. BIGb0407]